MASALTLSATTLEQQAFEIATRLRQDIADYVAANPANDIQGLSTTVTLNVAANVATVNMVLPLSQAEDTDGGISFDATEVLV